MGGGVSSDQIYIIHICAGAASSHVSASYLINSTTRRWTGRENDDSLELAHERWSSMEFYFPLAQIAPSEEEEEEIGRSGRRGLG